MWVFCRSQAVPYRTKHTHMAQESEKQKENGGANRTIVGSAVLHTSETSQQISNMFELQNGCCFSSFSVSQESISWTTLTGNIRKGVLGSVAQPSQVDKTAKVPLDFLLLSSNKVLPWGLFDRHNQTQVLFPISFTSSPKSVKNVTKSKQSWCKLKSDLHFHEKIKRIVLMIYYILYFDLMFKCIQIHSNDNYFVQGYLWSWH